jgi:hypothetical protein
VNPLVRIERAGHHQHLAQSIKAARLVYGQRAYVTHSISSDGVTGRCGCWSGRRARHTSSSMSMLSSRQPSVECLI